MLTPDCPSSIDMLLSWTVFFRDSLMPVVASFRQQRHGSGEEDDGYVTTTRRGMKLPSWSQDPPDLNDFADSLSIAQAKN